MEVDSELRLFSRHVGTNYVPTETELVKIKTLLEEPQRRMDELDAEISKTKARLEELLKQKETLDRSSQGYRALVSPLRRIPPDLLREIFLACLPQDRNPSMCNEEAPMLLTQISGEWRQIAHDTPRLWAAIHVPIPDSPSPFWSQPNDLPTNNKLAEIIELRTQAVETWLERSGACPLSVSVHEWNASPSNPEFRRFITRCLIPVCGRWRDISFTTSSHSLSPTQSLAASQVPMLESLRLQLSASAFFSQPVEHQMGWKAGGILESPGLSTFRISASDRDIPYGCVNWRQLTILEIEGNTWQDRELRPDSPNIKTVLRECVSLVEFTVTMGHLRPFLGSPVNHEEERPIDLPFLIRLTVQEEPGSTILPLLRTPNLRKVSYSCAHVGLHQSSTQPSPLLEFMQLNPDILVEELYTSCSSVPSDEFLECLRRCPSLHTLSINISRYIPLMSRTPGLYDNDDVMLTDDFLALLAPSEEEEILCPKLEDLELMLHTKFSEDAVLRFISKKQGARDDGISRLKSVRVHMGKKEPVESDIMKDLVSHVKEGLRVEVLYVTLEARGRLSLYDGLPDT